MYELVISNGKGRDVTTSLLVAEVFGKNHKEVLRDIYNLTCSIEFNERNFALISYTDGMNREQPAYEMTKDGFSFLVMGYNGERASQFKEQFIAEFNKREALLKNDDYILNRALEISHKRMRALEAANERLTGDVAILETKTIEQQKAIEAAAPKTLFADAVTASQNSILIRGLAKLIAQNGVEIGEKRLFYWLRENEYLCRVGESRNLPTQKSMELGLMEIKVSTRIGPNGTVFTDSTPKVTGKGQLYFVNKFLKTVQ